MTILLLLSSLALGLLLWSRRGSALDRAARELREARTQPGKRLRLASPDRPVEELLAQINGLLEDREQETRALEPLLAGFYEDFERAGFQVTVELDEHLPPVLADPGAVTRILTNLIGNALKHGRAALTIRLYASGGQLVTAFSNDAPGLSPEDLSRVFERFYTADQMRTGQNTGLGLAIVKALAQRMGHTPFAELDDGTFTVGVRWKPLLPSSREAPRPLQIN